MCNGALRWSSQHVAVRSQPRHLGSRKNPRAPAWRACGVPAALG
ncbi:hypothetical protein HMPREF9337_00095 [Cutibacterium acnes HL096PA3]|nr:hypothetical protein HMPREF9610_01899 [Cutibacterium acnes HL027PA2]EFT74380.1 hypothetical protein HMPREF9592_00945 [Cutibacterium acnes HL046PA1]EGE75755.1 hypothetical protein HMPREF9337_00095 [Cutibacterium acnes HL096PA3]